MENMRLWGLCSWFLTFCFTGIGLVESYGQYDLIFQGPEKIDWCQTASYEFRIDRFSDESVNDLFLEISFDHDVAYISNSLGLLLTPEDPRRIIVDLNEFEQCSYISGSLEVFPECAESIVTLGVRATLYNDSQNLAAQNTQALIAAQTLQLSFGNYTYNGANEQLTKSITLTNVNSSPITSFDIILTYNEDFARVYRSSLGVISGMNQISIGPNDLPNGVLMPLESVEIAITHDLLACDIEFVNYDLVFDCDVGECIISQTKVDDNEVDRTVLEVTDFDYIEQELPPYLDFPYLFGLSLDYGVCAPVYNPIIIRHSDLEYSGTLADAYDVSFVYSYDDVRARPYIDCVDPSFQLNGTALSSEIIEPYVYSISFDAVMQDLDGDGGLQDLDGDGSYDDLARGDSVIVDIGILSIPDCEVLIQPVSGSIRAAAADLCGEPTFSPSICASIKDRHDISAVPWTNLPKDAAKDRYYRIGDTVLWQLNYRYSQNIDPLCTNTDMVLNVVIPNNLEWIDEDAQFLFREDSTQIALSVTREDTMLTVPFDGSNIGYFGFRFIAICPENPIANYNPNIPIEEQCIEWKTYNILATIDNQCGEDCDRSIRISLTFSTTFRTLCEEEEVYQNVVELDSFVINRMNGGWMDSAQTMRWDPEVYKDSPNQSIFYDHDTMRIQIPFLFNRSNVIDALRLTIGNRLNHQEVDLELFRSTLLVYDRESNTLKNQCDLGPFTSDDIRYVILNLRRSDFDDLCISESDSMVWELMLTLNVERSASLERNSYLQEGIRMFAEERVGSCFEKIVNFESSYYVSEVFNPRLFKVSTIDGFQNFDFSLDDIRFVGLPLVSSFFGGEFPEVDYEVRFPNRLGEFQIEIPLGYEFVDSSFQLIGALANFSLFDTSVTSETLLNIDPISSEATDSSFIFHYTMPQNPIALSAINQTLFIGTSIRSVCPPSRESQSVRMSGYLEYDDYYEGRLRATPFNFALASPVEFALNDIRFEDDFKFSKGGEIEWQLNNEKQRSFLDFRNSRKIPWILEYESNHIVIDSILAFVYAGGPTELTELKDYTFERIDENRFLIQEVQSNDDLFLLDLSTLKIYTSQQTCGYDSITIRYGQASLWEDGLCPEEIFEDQLIVYTPVGLPQTRWIRYPEFIELCDTSWFRWKLSNIGEGELTTVSLRILTPEVQNPRLVLTIDSLAMTVDEADLTYQNDGYEFIFSDIGIDTLFGLIDLNREDIVMDWYWTPDCTSPTLYNVDIEISAQTYCEEGIVSRRIPLTDIPLRTLQDTAYSIELNAVSGPVCGDTVMMRLEVDAIFASQLLNDSLLVYLPREYAYYPGSSLANGRQLSDPSIEYKGAFQILSWVNTVRFSEDESFILEFLLDGACSDLCGRGEGRAILMSQVETSCNNVVCERYTSRASTPWELHFWRPKMELDIINFEELSIQDAMIQAVATWDLSQIRNHIYDGQITAQYYRDTDGNDLINIDEEVLFTNSFYFDSSQHIIITDTIESQVSDACELSLFISIERDCACFTAAEPIGMLDRVTTSQELVLCATETYEVAMNQIVDCSRTWNMNPRLDVNDPDSPIYNPRLTPDFVGRDTLVSILDCEGCDFVDSIFIEVYELNPIVILEMSACNDNGATVSANIDHPDPEALDYAWSIRPGENSPTIQDVPFGMVELTVTDDQGCDGSTMIFIEPYDIEYDILLTGDLCDPMIGQTVEIVIQNNDTQDLTVVWSDGIEGVNREGLFTGVYPFEIVASDGCYVADTLEISSSDLSAIRYQDSYTVELGRSLTIDPEEEIGRGFTFAWNSTSPISCDTCASIVISPMGSTELSVIITDSLGCQKTQRIMINVESKLNIYIPNVLTKHGDPRNAILYPAKHPFVALIQSFRIFDRWGNSVMDKENLDPSDVSQGWTGEYRNRPASPGVYVYDIAIVLIDGSVQRFTSSVTLLP